MTSIHCYAAPFATQVEARIENSRQGHEHGEARLDGLAGQHPARTRAALQWSGSEGTAIANEVEVKLPAGGERSDTETAKAALTALQLNASVPANTIHLVVQDGWVTLKGEVAFWFQKQAAESTVRHVHGVIGITDNIALKAPTSTTDVKARIEQAFRRHAQLDADKIHVYVSGGTVTLEGEVQSWPERTEAEIAAWAAPGVTSIQDRLTVRP